jgi:hypothetical protein
MFRVTMKSRRCNRSPIKPPPQGIREFRVKKWRTAWRQMTSRRGLALDTHILIRATLDSKQPHKRL